MWFPLERYPLGQSTQKGDLLACSLGVFMGVFIRKVSLGVFLVRRYSLGVQKGALLACLGRVPLEGVILACLGRVPLKGVLGRAGKVS